MKVEELQHAKGEISDSHKDILLAPVFIVGSGRSGTTWLQRLLLEHPEITGGQESEFFLHFSSCLRGVQRDDEISRKLGLSVYWAESDLNKVIMNIWQKTFISMLNQKPGAKILSEKTPSHAHHMDVIAKFLPNSKFIHIIRDSRSVVSSMLAAEKGWGKSWAPGTAKKCAWLWRSSVVAAKKSGNNMPDERYLEVRYEDLLNNTNNELSRIYSYLGVNFNSELLAKIVDKQSMHKQKLSGGTGFKDYKGNDLKEPNGFFRKGKVDSWKSELNIFQKLIVWRYTWNILRKFGYDWNGRINENLK